MRMVVSFWFNTGFTLQDSICEESEESAGAQSVKMAEICHISLVCHHITNVCGGCIWYRKTVVLQIHMS